MKHTIKTLALGLLATAALSSCSDFLDLGPKHSLTMENSVTDYTTAKEIVNGIYGVYKDQSSLGGSLYTNLACMAGMWTYSSAMYNMTYTQSSISSGEWFSLYKCINACNAAINGVSALSDGVFPSVEAKNALLGEARCFRGFCNLHLLWLFSRWWDNDDSPYGIIYRDQTSELSNLMVPRLTVGESYEKVLEDLEFAEKNAPDYTSALTMSRQMAQVLHAKLLMARGKSGDYAKALEIVNDVFATAPAEFAMETDITALYENGWNSKEVLFSRYLGDLATYTYSEFAYSYSFYYNPNFTDLPTEWLQADERYPYITGEARAPETWDTGRKEGILTKLYHRGRYEGPNDMYATYVFRYAELYLMKAELMARTNPSDIAGALAEVNKMRATYATPVMPEITGVNNIDDLMDVIFKEYVVTLFMENETVWFASLRFNHDGQPWLNTLKSDMNLNENAYCWPIPDAEMVSNAAVAGMQNPGLE